MNVIKFCPVLSLCVCVCVYGCFHIFIVCVLFLAGIEPRRKIKLGKLCR